MSSESSSNMRVSSVTAAAGVLATGGVVVFPTETVYGLGADARNPAAVARIFAIKGRPADNPLIVHVASAGEVARVATLPAAVVSIVDALFAAFSPGPLTLVLPASESLPRIVTAGLDTVALRIPDHPVALDLIRAAGCPVAAPSANRSGSPSPTSLAMAATSLASSSDQPDAWVDGGRCRVGLESTVVRVSAEALQILRPGAVTAEQLRGVTGLPVGAASPAAAASPPAAALPPAAASSPGTRYAHYQPRTPVVLFRTADELCTRLVDEHTGRPVVLSLPDVQIDSRCPDLSLTVTHRVFGDLDAYARGLFAAFARADAQEASTIYAQLPSERGLGVAIADRLRRAAGGHADGSAVQP